MGRKGAESQRIVMQKPNLEKTKGGGGVGVVFYGTKEWGRGGVLWNPSQGVINMHCCSPH